MKILFVTSNRLGDTVLSTGLLRHLEYEYPGAEFTIACGPIPSSLFEPLPGLKNLIILNKKSFSLHWVDLWAKTVTHCWDIVVDLRGSGLAYLLWTRERYIWQKSPHVQHKVEEYAQLLKLPSPPAPYLWITPDDEKAIAPLTQRPFIVIGPAANWTCKEWPLENFAQLLSSPEFQGHQIFLVGAPHESMHIEKLCALTTHPLVHNIAGKYSLRALGALLKQADLFIGNDSGLMHLAAAAGCPTLGLFGPSPEKIYAPWGSHCDVVRSPIPYEILWKDAAPRGPCLMNDITVDMVHEKAVALLKEPRRF